jgi:hypothetical protein
MEKGQKIQKINSFGVFLNKFRDLESKKAKKSLSFDFKGAKTVFPVQVQIVLCAFFIRSSSNLKKTVDNTYICGLKV